MPLSLSLGLQRYPPALHGRREALSFRHAGRFSSSSMPRLSPSLSRLHSKPHHATIIIPPPSPFHVVFPMQLLLPPTRLAAARFRSPIRLVFRFTLLPFPLPVCLDCRLVTDCRRLGLPLVLSHTSSARQLRSGRVESWNSERHTSCTGSSIPDGGDDRNQNDVGIAELS